MSEAPKNNSKFIQNLVLLIVAIAGVFLIVKQVKRETTDASRDVAKEAAKGIVDAGKDAAKEAVKDVQDNPAQYINSAGDLLRSAIGTANDVVTGIAPLTPPEEISIGRMFYDDITQGVPLHSSSDLQNQIITWSTPLLDKRKRKELAFTVSVLDDSSMNAFSTVGGYVYVNSGLVSEFERDADAIKFVLGHEIGHIDLGHTTKNATALVQAYRIGGDQAGPILHSMYQFIAQGYSQDEEFQADAYANDLLKQIGMTKEQRLKGMKRLLAYHEKNGGYQSTAPNTSEAANAIIQQIRRHFESHPHPADRLKRLEAMP
jgi:predicted Zn-dependent protease